jgi:hypothetical protein
MPINQENRLGRCHRAIGDAAIMAHPSKPEGLRQSVQIARQRV